MLKTQEGGDQGPPVDLGTFTAAPGRVREYLRAVGDDLPTYFDAGLAPPLYPAATALGMLLRQLGLPSGAVHSLQEIETLQPVEIGQELTVSATLERPRKRGGLEFITAVCRVEGPDGGLAITSKSTVMVASGQGGQPQEKVTAAMDRKGEPQPSLLPVVSSLITQDRLNDYAAASGDDNPLHLDPEFAAGTQFGGIIAHGMLTLAFISEMMTRSQGPLWLETGAMRARFKGAAYLGATVETWGDLARGGDYRPGEPGEFSVAAKNAATGQELATGTARTGLASPKS